MGHVKETQISKPETLCPGNLLEGRVGGSNGCSDTEQWLLEDTPDSVWPLLERGLGPPMAGAWIPDREVGSGHRAQTLGTGLGN